MDLCDKEKVELVPENGWLLKPVEVTFKQGQSVFDVLQQVCRDNKIHMEFSMTPIYNSAYIEGIGNLYEFDCGEVSGWMYKVNDWFPNYGCSRYQLQNVPRDSMYNIPSNSRYVKSKKTPPCRTALFVYSRSSSST